MTLATPGAGIEPFFLSAKQGDLFSIYYPPQTSAPCRGGVLLFPAFAEEMNRTRHLSSLQARLLAQQGYAVLSIDPYGTGDSPGDFADALWDDWKENMLLGFHWFESRQIQPVSLLGIRTGCLLALDVIRDYGVSQIQHVVFWQPVVSGESFMNQFLRLSMAADFVSSGGSMTTKEVRAALLEGKAMEIAGYMLSPELYRTVRSLDFNHFADAGVTMIHWLETVAAQDRPISMVSKRIIERDEWKGRIRLEKITGEPFWATPEITIVPAILEKTTAIFSERDASHG